MVAVVRALRPVFALGIDPGPTAGIALLRLGAVSLAAGAEIYQCNAAAAPWLLHQLLGPAGVSGTLAAAGIEGFAPGNGPGARRKPGRATAGQVGELEDICAEYGVPVAVRYAGLVKPWATDRRLDAAGLLGLTPGSTHARDGCRHALYCAVHDCGWPDPLSQAGRRFSALTGEK